VGTSGWNYAHWRDVFYPDNIPKSRWLEFYTENFDTVELNATFYRQPRNETFKNWYKRTPEGFLWSVKVSKFITHTKRLKDCEDALVRFYDGVLNLKEKLGPILIQLPPGLVFERDLFKSFCSLLNSSLKHTIEVRNKTWLCDDAFEIMRKHNIAFCISDTAGRYPYHEEVTADFIYIRLHGSKKLYASEYTEDEIRQWASKIGSWNMETYIYFDNDFNGYAVKNAFQLKQELNITP
jgi:uncharacterized protein YecE (DUF72 family)